MAKTRNRGIDRRDKVKGIYLPDSRTLAIINLKKKHGLVKKKEIKSSVSKTFAPV